jgi:hypothetical protein
MFSHYLLSDQSVKMLMRIFPPRFPDVFAHHITYEFGTITQEVPETDDISVVGYVCGDQRVEALIVSVNGSIYRPDGEIFHIMWSLDRKNNVTPKFSNDAIKRAMEDGSVKLFEPIKIFATAKQHYS